MPRIRCQQVIVPQCPSGLPSTMPSRAKTWSIVGAVGVAIAILGLVLAFGVFPWIVQAKVSLTVSLREGEETWDRWKTLPIPLLLKLYVFNVTNPHEVMRGAKPVVQEIGPYVYKQYRRKEKIKPNAYDDVVSYEQTLHHEFDQTLSGNRTEDDHIVVLNAALAATMNLMENIPAMSKSTIMLEQVADLMFPKSIGVFLPTTPGELFFRGVRIHCNTTPRSIPLLVICSSMKNIRVQTITMRKDGDLNFSVFGYKNTTTEGEVTIKMGRRDVLNLGQIVSWNGKRSVEAWGGPTCNAINGTAGDIFAPFVTPERTIQVFSPDICRSMTMKYFGPTNYKGIPGYRFRLDRTVFQDPRSNGNNYCFCPQRAKGLTVENGCLKSGALDVSGCQGVPVIMTFPHFLLADPAYQKGVVGLRPNPDDHEMTLDVEPHTGAPLRGGKKMQINVHMKRVNGVNFTSNLQDALMPILWMYEGVELTDELVGQIKSQLINTLMILDVVSYTLLGIGVLVVLVAGGMIWRIRTRQRRKSLVSTPGLMMTSS